MMLTVSLIHQYLTYALHSAYILIYCTVQLRDSAPTCICELAARLEKELDAGSKEWDELKVIETIDNMRQ